MRSVGIIKRDTVQPHAALRHQVAGPLPWLRGQTALDKCIHDGHSGLKA